MTKQTLNLELRGLYTSPNNLSGVPQGSLEIADNVVINSKNLIDSRRGQGQYGSPLAIGMGQGEKLFNYKSDLIANYASKLAYDSDGAGDWVPYSGDYLSPSSTMKIRSLESNSNFYFTTSKGIYKLDILTGTPIPAGVVRALSGVGTLSGTSGWFIADSAVAYRIVWGYRDANDNLLLGAPSQRIIVVNATVDNTDVSLQFIIPDSITTNYFYQIYRSFGSASAADEPTDELQLVLEYSPTAAEIAAKSITIIDKTPYSLMRATLYTSPSQEGIANSNFPPPLSNDMDVYKNCAFYANVRQKQTLPLTLISVESPSFGYVSETGDTTNLNAVITNIGTTANLRVGMRVVGTGIQTDSRILSVDSATQVTMTKTATVTDTTVDLEFQDRLTVANVDYWGGTTQDAATNTFLVDISSTPGVNIDETATNLVEIVNTSSLNATIYAYYLSALDDLPGQILFEERLLGGDTFIATSTSGGSFSPAIPDQIPLVSISVANPTVVTTLTPHGLTTGNQITLYQTDSTPTVNGIRTVTVTSATTFTIPVNVTVIGTTGYLVPTAAPTVSTNETNQNRVFISKDNQPEAVPIYRFFNIGSANFPIQRVVALRDGIFFFKQDGVYRLTGETFESFVVTLLDNTVVLKVPESAVAFNNQIFCFTTQGVCAVSDSGIRIISVPIEDRLLQLASEQFTYFSTASFGVAYESARLYMFFTVTEETDQFATQAFIYNSLTESWTRWVMNRTCGVVNPTVNKLFMIQTDTGQVFRERKNYTSFDYADEQYPITIDTVDSETQITILDATNVVAGMTVLQDLTTAYIEAVDGLVLTIAPTLSLVPGAAEVYTPILNRVQWSPIDVENPGMFKQFSEISLFFKNAAFSEIEAGFSTNASNGFQVVPILNFSASWGNFPWGEALWGGVPSGQAVLRTYVPKEKQRGNWLTLYLKTEEAFTGFSLQGVSLNYKSMSTRIK